MLLIIKTKQKEWNEINCFTNLFLLNAKLWKYNNQNSATNKFFQTHFGITPKHYSIVLFAKQKEIKSLLGFALRLEKLQNNAKQARISSYPMKHCCLACNEANVLCCNLFPCCNTILRKKLGKRALWFFRVDIVQNYIKNLITQKNNIHSIKLRSEIDESFTDFVKYNDY